MSDSIINVVMAFYSSFVPCVTQPSESYGVREWDSLSSLWSRCSHDISFHLHRTVKQKAV